MDGMEMLSVVRWLVVRVHTVQVYQSTPLVYQSTPLVYLSIATPSAVRRSHSKSTSCNSRTKCFRGSTFCTTVPSPSSCYEDQRSAPPFRARPLHSSDRSENEFGVAGFKLKCYEGSRPSNNKITNSTINRKQVAT